MYEITISKKGNKWLRHTYCIADGGIETTEWKTKRQAMVGHD